MTDWIEWHGGECPVPPDTMVEVRYRSAILPISAADLACRENWDWQPSEHGLTGSFDIVAYRVISEKPKPEEPKPSQPWVEFPRWYRHDGGPAPCPPEIWVEVPGQYAVVRREHAATIQWYGIQYWRPADDRYEFKFDGDRLAAYRLKEATR